MSVEIYYLEMRSAAQLQAKPQPQGLVIQEAEIKEYRFNRYLYQLVGEPWHWCDKLNDTDEQWKNYAEADNLRTWVAYRQGSIAGYFELQRQQDGDVEIVYFGVAPQFIGQGIGGYLLTQALTMAWQWQGTQRVWVHTCSLDHPGALQNYKARGMQHYKTEVEA